jgi:hypothetical protein
VAKPVDLQINEQSATGGTVLSLYEMLFWQIIPINDYIVM